MNSAFLCRSLTVSSALFAMLAPPLLKADTDVWTGAASGIWDTSAVNWTNSGSGVYTSGDSVQFGDTGGANFTISPSAAVTPASVTFSDTGAGTNAYVFNGSAINGSGSVTLASGFGGSATFNVANGYTGGTIINSGTVFLNNASGLGTGTVAVGVSGAITIASVNPGNVFTGSGVINTGTSSVQFTSGTALNGFTGTLNVSASGNNKTVLTTAGQNLGSGTTVNISNGGTLFMTNITAPISGVTFNLNGNGNGENLGALRFEGVTVGSTSSIVLQSNSSIGGNGMLTNNAVISETGGARQLTKQGNGTVILTAANTFTGGVNLATGTLQIGNGGTTGSLSTTGTIQNFSTLAFNRSNTVTQGVDFGAISGGSGTIVQAGTGTLVLTGVNGSTGYGLTLSGGGTVNFNEGANVSQNMTALTLTGGGTVQSTYGGSGNTALTFSDVVAPATGGTANFVVSGGTNGTTNKIVLTQFGGSTTSTGTLLNKGLFFNGSSYATYDSGGFVRAYGSSDANYLAAPAGATIGASTSTSNVDLTTGNITAQTTVSANTVNMEGNSLTMSAAGQVLSTSSILSNGNSNATLGSTGGSLQALTAGGDIVVRVNGGSDKLTIGSIIQNNTSTSTLTKSGAGTLVLTGVNTYTGSTAINAGTLTIGGAGQLNAGSYSGAIANSGVLNYNSTANQTLSGVISGIGAVTQTGTGMLTLSNANTYTGGTTVTAGGIYLNNDTAAGTGTITLAGGALVYSNQSWNNALNVTGSSTIVNTSDNIDGQHKGALTGNGTLTVAPSVTVGGTTYNGTSSFKYNGDLSGFTGTFVDATASNVIFQGNANNGYNAKFVVNGNGSSAAFVGSNSGLGGIFQMGELSGTNSSAVILANYNSGITTVYQIGALNTNSTYAGQFQNFGGGVAAITKVGTGTLILSGANNTSGADTVNAGTLQFAKAQALYNSNTGNWNATNIIVNSGATLALNVGGSGEFTSGNIGNIAALGTPSGGFKSGSYLGLDTTNAGGQFIYTSAIGNTNSGSNVIGLVKLGTGTLTLTGANTYTGGTIVKQGTLEFNNDFTMSGANQVFVAATGSAGTNYATVTSTAGLTGLTFGGTLGVKLTASLVGGEIFNLFQNAGGGLTGDFSNVSISGSYIASLTDSAGIWTGTGNGFNFTFSTTSGILSVASAIPEPSTYAAIFSAMVLSWVGFKRRRTKSA